MSITAKIRALWSRNPRLRWPAVLALCFAVYSFTGFLLLPPIIKAQLVKQLPQLTKRTARVREVRVNPWTLSLTVRGLALNEADGSAFASWEEFYANFQLSSIFRRAWTFDEIHLIDPHGAIVLQRNGQWNIANLFASTNSPSTTNAVPRLFVYRLSITNGFVSIEDQTRHRPFRTEYRPINILVRNLSTRPGADTPYSFHAENDTGKTLDWTGDITVQPFSSRGRLDVKRGQPKKYQPFLEDYTAAEITDGRVNISGDYFVATGTNGLDLVITHGRVQLTNLQVSDTNAPETVLSLPDLTMDGLQLNLRERRAEAATLKMTGTELHTRLNQDGSFNLLRLLVSAPTNQPANTNVSRPWLVNLKEFAFEQGTLSFEDRSRKSPFATRLSPIEVKLKDFSTTPGTEASYHVLLSTEASEKFAGAGSLAINPARSAGEVAISAIEIKKYQPFFEQQLHAEIASGKVDLKVNYSVTPEAAVLTNALVRLTDFLLKSADNRESLVSIPEFSLEGADANTQERAAHIARVKTAGGVLLVRRETNGSLNLASMVHASDGSGARSTAGTNAGWSGAIAELALENFSVNFEDRQLTTPASVKLDQIAVNLKGISTAPEKPVGTSVSMRINEGGSLAVKGTVVPAPTSAEIDLSLTNIDLRAIQPYLESRARLQLVGGSLNLASHAIWERTGTNTEHLQFTGDLSLPALATVANGTNLVSWTNLALDGIKLQLGPDSLHIDTIRLDGLDANLSVNSNRQLNVTTLFPPTTNTPLAEPKPASKLPITVNTFALTNSALRLVDESIQPVSTTELQEFGGTVTGLSSDPSARAEVNLAGSFGEHSPFSITGQINPLAAEPHVDLTITNHNMQLAAFTPYMEKFAGHPLNRGRLSMTLHYKIAGRELQAENHVQIDQLTLGPHVDSPDASKLPIKLAVALLKDMEGRILLDVPVAGRLDDPQFRVGPIILKVFVNLITKAVASPFKLLGAAVGGGEELSFLEFCPGSADFAEGETNKVGKLVKALSTRPGLTLELEGSIDPHLDRDLFARQIVQQRIKSARLAELASVNATPVEVEKFEVEPVEQQRLLRAAVTASFGTNLTEAVADLRSSLTNQLASASLAEAHPHPWYQTVLIPFQGKDSPAAVARRQAKADAELLKQNPELGNLNSDLMEKLLAAKVEVPPAQFIELIKQRTEAVREQLLKSTELTEDRLSIVAPKPLKEGYRGEARVNLSLN